MSKEIGVSVYFEEQGIDTEKLNMEMIVTFPGMAAQQESVNIRGICVGAIKSGCSPVTSIAPVRLTALTSRTGR